MLTPEIRVPPTESHTESPSLPAEQQLLSSFGADGNLRFSPEWQLPFLAPHCTLDQVAWQERGRAAIPRSAVGLETEITFWKER